MKIISQFSEGLQEAVRVPFFLIGPNFTPHGFLTETSNSPLSHIFLPVF